MNKVIIAGHSAAEISEVEACLRNHGMQSPLPSRREGFQPSEITDALLRAHRPALSKIAAEKTDYRQIVAAPVWHGIAADLLLGNAEQQFWGWADTQSIHVLDYWSELDPQAAFILVYDKPGRALEEAAVHEDGELNESSTLQCLDDWLAYNGAMLEFFLRHPERCLLVSSSQVRSAPDEFFAQLGGCLQIPGKPGNRGEEACHEIHTPRTESIRRALALTTRDPAKAINTLRAEAAERYLLDHYLDGHPSYLHFYSEMQASANLPFLSETKGAEPSDAAWRALVAQRRLMNEIIDQFYQERCLQLSQLHQVQEQLEYLHMRGETWQDKTKIAAPKMPSKQKKTLGAAERVKQQLSYRLGATLVKRSRSLGGWLLMPFSLTAEVFHYRADQKRRGSKKFPPIHTYDDAHEADRVRNHLSYRLGSVLVKHGRNPAGWFTMPFALVREWKAFQQTRASRHPATRPSKS
ncbi:MAG: hypothetical protein ABI162_14160 [Luteolibacter sp.]